MKQIVDTEGLPAACKQGRLHSLRLGSQSPVLKQPTLCIAEAGKLSIFVFACLRSWYAMLLHGSFLLQLREEEGSQKTALHRGSSVSSKIWLVVSVFPW